MHDRHDYSGVLLGLHHTPPRETFKDIVQDRILFGHSDDVFDNPTEALADALDGSKRGFHDAREESQHEYPAASSGDVGLTDPPV